MDAISISFWSSSPHKTLCIFISLCFILTFFFPSIFLFFLFCFFSFILVLLIFGFWFSFWRLIGTYIVSATSGNQTDGLFRLNLQRSRAHYVIEKMEALEDQVNEKAKMSKLHSMGWNQKKRKETAFVMIQRKTGRKRNRD